MRSRAISSTFYLKPMYRFVPVFNWSLTAALLVRVHYGFFTHTPCI